MPTGGTLTVAISSSTEKKGVLIEVTDTGVGIPPKDIDQIWKPFYSTKVPRKNNLNKKGAASKLAA
jgi:signal transduction histidine kinase